MQVHKVSLPPAPKKKTGILKILPTTLFLPVGEFWLERLREVIESSTEGDKKLTGGSIRSLSDYAVQLRDFESAFEGASKYSQVGQEDHSSSSFAASVTIQLYSFLDKIVIRFEMRDSTFYKIASPKVLSSETILKS